MDKEKLLRKIEHLELARLNALSHKEVKEELQDWFTLVALPKEPKATLITVFMTDFMKWRSQDSVEELQEKLLQY